MLITFVKYCLLSLFCYVSLITHETLYFGFSFSKLSTMLFKLVTLNMIITSASSHPSVILHSCLMLLSNEVFLLSFVKYSYGSLIGIILNSLI